MVWMPCFPRTCVVNNGWPLKRSHCTFRSKEALPTRSFWLCHLGLKGRSMCRSLNKDKEDKDLPDFPSSCSITNCLNPPSASAPPSGALVPIIERFGLEGTLNTTWFHSPTVDRDPFH